MRTLTAPLLLASLAIAASDASGQTLTLEPVASGLTRPIYLTSAPGDPYAVYIVEQRSGTTGRVQRHDLRTGQRTLFASVSGVSTDNEEGLLGLAFHPAHATNGLLFVYYTSEENLARISRVDRFARGADPLAADQASQSRVMQLGQPFDNHNGGWMAFSPDGYLLIATGDGGSSFDPDDSGQRTNTLLGKILRIDTDGDDFPADPVANYAIPPTNPGPAGALPGALPEIYHYGLRNPWRNGVDAERGLLYIADVGQGQREEVNVVDITDSGLNFGWRCFEGTRDTGLCDGDPTGVTMPEHEYTHSFAGFSCSITGGEVYYGRAMPFLAGTYFFADYCSQRVLTMTGAPGAYTVTDVSGQIVLGANPVSFGRDAYGEVYVCTLDGRVRRIAGVGVSAELCVADVNTTNTNPGDTGYGVPNGVVDGADLSYFIESWLGQSPLVGDQTTTNANPGDPGYGAPDGAVDGADLSFYVEAWLAGCA